MHRTQKEYGWILPVLTGAVLAGCGLLYYSIIMMPRITQSFSDCFLWFRHYYGEWTILLLMILGGGAGYLLHRYGKEAGDFVYRYRWWIAAGLIVIGVLFKLNGSSLGSIDTSLPQGEEAGLILGKSRPIRSDEYAVFTPMAIAQYNQGFPYFGTAFRGTATDMFGVYGQPVMHFLVLFRPFQIGYLILPLEYGFSFYWVARAVLLFMVSFEMGMILCRKKRLLALTYASLVALSPWVAWWFSINCFVEQLLFGQLLVIWLRQYLLTHDQKKRWGYIIGLAWAAVTYALTLYPTTEIPFVYIFGSLGLWQAVTLWKDARIDLKKDGLRLLTALVIIGGALGVFFIKSGDAIKIVSETVYPGLTENKWPLSKIFGTWVYGPFLPFNVDAWLSPNQVELASFYGLAPLGLILSSIQIVRGKKIFQKENTGFLLLILFLFLFALCRPFGEATIIAKILLLKMRTLRLYALMTYIDLVLLFMALSQDWSFVKKKDIGILTGAGTAVLVAVTWFIPLHLLKYPLLDWMVWGLVILLALAFAGAIAGIKWEKARTYWCVFLIALSVLMGCCVNPLRAGMDTIIQNPAYLEAQKIGDSEGVWLVDSASHKAANVLAAAGAPVITSTNTYPDLERWEEVLGKKKMKIYNRYAHINVILQNDEPTRAKLMVSDQFDVYLNTEDLKKLDVSMVYSTRELQSLDTSKVRFKLVKDLDGAYIYKVIYK